MRGVAFEFWGKDDGPGWRAPWEWAIVVGSFAPRAAVGRRVGEHRPRRAHRRATSDLRGTCSTLLNPYALLGGVTTLLLFLAHGAIFLTLRTDGDLPERARAIARWASPAAAAAGVAVPGLDRCVDIAGGDAVVVALAVSPRSLLAVSAIAGLARAARRSPSRSARRDRRAVRDPVRRAVPERHAVERPGLRPDDRRHVVVHYTLDGDDVVAAILVPVVLMYQAWTYWVFRKRVSPEDFDPELRNPLDVIRADQDDSSAQPVTLSGAG